MGTTMKILFTVFYDPKDLGIRYLTSYLKNEGHDVRIVALKNLDVLSQKTLKPDANEIADCRVVRNAYLTKSIFRNITDKELDLLSEIISSFQPELIGFGTRSKNFQHLARIIPALRKGNPSAFLACGGAGPTLEPEIPLELGVDAVIRGEGEYALSELITALSSGQDWRSIKNISYRDRNGQIIRNPMRAPQKDINKFPFPSNEHNIEILIDNDTIISNYGQEINPNSLSSDYRYIILGSRGCMGNCSYCGGRYLKSEYQKDNINIPRVRQRSLDNILEELIYAKAQTNMKFVQFADEYFVWPTEKLIHFFKAYKEKITLPFLAYLSVEQLAKSEELLSLVCDAGLSLLSIGLQTADEAFCKAIYNRRNNNDAILYTINRIHAKGIPVELLMILGNPIQPKESLEKNWEFLAQLPSFDPSFKRYIWIQFAKLIKPYYPSQLFNEHDIDIQKISCEQFYYDAMICNLRLIVDDDKFNEIISNNIYKEKPELLSSLYYNTLVTKHMEYLQPELERIAGQEVYFWGSGTAYQKKKHLLNATKPICILNDFTWEAASSVDGLPITDPATAELDTEKPLIIFARHEYVHAIHRKARNIYGFKDIIVAANIE